MYNTSTIHVSTGLCPALSAVEDKLFREAVAEPLKVSFS